MEFETFDKPPFANEFDAPFLRFFIFPYMALSFFCFFPQVVSFSVLGAFGNPGSPPFLLARNKFWFCS